MSYVTTQAEGGTQLISCQIAINSGIFDINNQYYFESSPAPWCDAPCALFTVNASPQIAGTLSEPDTKANQAWNSEVIASGYNTSTPLDGEYVDSFDAQLDVIDYDRYNLMRISC